MLVHRLAANRQSSWFQRRRRRAQTVRDEVATEGGCAPNIGLKVLVAGAHPPALRRGAQARSHRREAFNALRASSPRHILIADWWPHLTWMSPYPAVAATMAHFLHTGWPLCTVCLLVLILRLKFKISRCGVSVRYVMHLVCGSCTSRQLLAAKCQWDELTDKR